MTEGIAGVNHSGLQLPLHVWDQEDAIPVDTLFRSELLELRRHVTPALSFARAPVGTEDVRARLRRCAWEWQERLHVRYAAPPRRADLCIVVLVHAQLACEARAWHPSWRTELVLHEAPCWLPRILRCAWGVRRLPSRYADLAHTALLEVCDAAHDLVDPRGLLPRACTAAWAAAHCHPDKPLPPIYRWGYVPAAGPLPLADTRVDDADDWRAQLDAVDWRDFFASDLPPTKHSRHH